MRKMIHTRRAPASRVLSPNDQESVDRYFKSVASYWRDVYAADGLEPTIYRLRRSAALKMIDDLHLPRRARVLEIGCGAGFVTIELARRGFLVAAVDTSDTMLSLTRSRVREANVRDHVTVRSGDTHQLDFDSRVFSVVVALGVVPWLHSPRNALAEIARVLDRGGCVVISSENRQRLNHLLDPRLSPALSSPRKALGRLLAALGVWKAPAPSVQAQMYSLREFDELLASAGLRRIKAVTLGFGPFSLLGHTVLPDVAGVRVHRALQSLADRGVPGFRRTGSQYVVVAEKVD